MFLQCCLVANALKSNLSCVKIVIGQIKCLKEASLLLLLRTHESYFVYFTNVFTLM